MRNSGDKKRGWKPWRIFLALLLLTLTLLSAQAQSKPEPQPGAGNSAVKTKIMNQKSTMLRMRAYRVTHLQDNRYSEWIVLEDVERAQFHVCSYTSTSGPFPKGMKIPRPDRNDARSVLHCLKNSYDSREHAQSPPAIADSIDAAISQFDIRAKEYDEWARTGKAPSWALKEQEANRQRSEPPIEAVPVIEVSDTSKKEIQRMQKEVWDYTGGKQLKWKPAGHTPAGRQCEVLTFDGAEIVLVGPTSIEIPNSKTTK